MDAAAGGRAPHDRGDRRDAAAEARTRPMSPAVLDPGHAWAIFPAPG